MPNLTSMSVTLLWTSAKSQLGNDPLKADYPVSSQGRLSASVFHMCSQSQGVHRIIAHLSQSGEYSVAHAASGWRNSHRSQGRHHLGGNDTDKLCERQEVRGRVTTVPSFTRAFSAPGTIHHAHARAEWQAEYHPEGEINFLSPLNSNNSSTSKYFTHGMLPYRSTELGGT